MKTTIAKKWLAALLCALTVLASLVIVPLTASAAAWDGKTVTEWEKMKGTGTKEDPYLIGTPADYAAVVANADKWTATANQYFKLTADLDFGGKQVNGISLANLAPKIEGNNHTISNFKSQWSLFDNVEAGTEFKNLKFVGFFVSRPATVAVLAQIVKGDTLIENVTIDETSALTSTTKYASAFVGEARGNVTFRNCTTQATLNAGNFAGAYVAVISNTANVTIENCLNAGKITVGSASSASDVHAGGFIGGALDGKEFNITMINCANVGDIHVQTTAKNPSNSAAGFIGSTGYVASQAGKCTVNLTNCYNGGDITAVFPAKGDYTYGTGNVGGAIGYFRFGGTGNLNGVYNTGALTVNADSKAWVNGIIGTGTGPELIKNFVNLYSLAEDHYGNKGDTAAYGSTACVHGHGYSKAVFKTYAYCDLMPSVSTEIKVATAVGADGTMGTADDVVEMTTMQAKLTALLNALHPTHDYKAACSTACSVCTLERTNAAAHTTGGACDATCNACGETVATTAEHQTSGACDTACNVCQETLTTNVAHSYAADSCDGPCTVCGMARPRVTHTVDGACDPVCNLCNAPTSTTSSHLYTNKCDAACNICGFERTPYDHVYTDDNDPSCNVCGDTRELSTPVEDEKPADETTAPETEATTAAESTAEVTDAPAEEGCGSSVVGIGALLALSASFGFALVGKKKED